MKDFLNDENTSPEELENKTSDSKEDNNEKVNYEENDNWQFDAHAPTLEDTLENGTIAIDMPVEKPKPQKATAPTAPKATKSRKSGNTVVFTLTAVFLVIIIAVIAVLGVRYYTVPNSDEKMNPGNVALTVGDTDISIGMYNYYYTAVSQNYITYASYGYYDIDTSTDYSKQKTTNSEGKSTTWANIFVEDTISQIQYITAYYEEAVKNGITLTDEQNETIESQLSSLKESASDSDMSVDEYIAENYGEYCGYATLKKMLIQAYTAENYYQQRVVTEKATDAEIDAYYKENGDDYLQVSFAYLQIPYSEASEEQDALKQAKKYAKQVSSVDDIKKLLPTACADLLQQYVDYGYFDDTDSAAETLAENVETTITKSDTSFTDEGMEWLFSDDTKVGDCSAFVDEDNLITYVVLKTGEPQLEDDEVYSVRHILIMPESDEDEDEDSDDTDDTETTYTDAQWAAALDKANEILDEYNSGDKTELSFALLAEEYSDDTESTSSGSSGLYGGLYGGTTLGTMVSSFEDWATDDSRKYGDVEIVKSDYGYHIMYFVEDTKDYLYECEQAVLTEKDNDFVDNTVVKRHKKAMTKTTVAQPTSTSTDSTDDNSEDMDY
jgi:hypothetical protein